MKTRKCTIAIFYLLVGVFVVFGRPERAEAIAQTCAVMEYMMFPMMAIVEEPSLNPLERSAGAVWVAGPYELGGCDSSDDEDEDEDEDDDGDGGDPWDASFGVTYTVDPNGGGQNASSGDDGSTPLLDGGAKTSRFASTIDSSTSTDPGSGTTSGGNTEDILVEVRMEASNESPLNDVTGIQIDFSLAAFNHVNHITWNSQYVSICDPANPTVVDCYDISHGNPLIYPIINDGTADLVFTADYADINPGTNLFDLPAQPASPPPGYLPPLILTVGLNVNIDSTVDICGVNENDFAAGIQVSTGFNYPPVTHIDGDGLDGTCSTNVGGGSNPIIFSDPPSGAIDARDVPQFSYVDLTFAGSAIGKNISSFDVTTIGGSGNAPVFTVQDNVGGNSSKVRITFTDAADVNAQSRWIKVRDIESNSSVHLGNLRCDVNQDGRANPEDVQKFAVDASTLALYRADINGNSVIEGGISGADTILLHQILEGCFQLTPLPPIN